MNIYDYMGITNDNFKVRKMEVMRRRHAVRIALSEEGYGLTEIARLEGRLFGSTPNHATIINSRHAQRDKIIQIYVNKAKEYLSQYPPAAFGEPVQDLSELWSVRTEHQNANQKA
jgi:hypothetical protein